LSKFVSARGDLNRVVPLQCSRCLHLRDHQLWTCDAFPNGIPALILTNSFDHRNAYPGDHGIRFEPIGGGPNDGNAVLVPDADARRNLVALFRAAKALVTRGGGIDG
jgi:hypothetical protein